MRILHISDFHFHRPWFRWAAAQAKDFDAVAFSGDFIEATRAPAVESQIDWVRNWVRDFPGRLLVCSGNHDDRPFDVPTTCRGWIRKLTSPRVTADFGKATIGQWRFECVPWEGQPTQGGGDTIALMHCPPQRATTAISHPESVDFGDFDLAENLTAKMNAPYLLLGGHVHRPRRWIARMGDSWSLNPGVDETRGGSVPHHIVIDLDRSLAIRHSATGDEERAFLG